MTFVQSSSENKSQKRGKGDTPNVFSASSKMNNWLFVYNYTQNNYSFMLVIMLDFGVEFKVTRELWRMSVVVSLLDKSKISLNIICLKTFYSLNQQKNLARKKRNNHCIWNVKRKGKEWERMGKKEKKWERKGKKEKEREKNVEKTHWNLQNMKRNLCIFASIVCMV